MPGALPNKGDGAREKAVADAKVLMADGEMSIREIVRMLTAKYHIASQTAYAYRREAERELAIETVEEQLVIGMLATRGALRCAQEGEVLARVMIVDAKGVHEQDKASAAMARAGRTYVQVARAAIDLDVGEMMSDDEQAEIIGHAVVANLHRMSPKLRRKLHAQLMSDGGKGVH